MSVDNFVLEDCLFVIEDVFVEEKVQIFWLAIVKWSNHIDQGVQFRIG